MANVTERQSIQNGNLSNTALQQAQVAAALTQGRINAAVAQVLAYQAVEQANRMQQAEIDRLERLAEWRDARARTNAMYRVRDIRLSLGRGSVQGLPCVENVPDELLDIALVDERREDEALQANHRLPVVGFPVAVGHGDADAFAAHRPLV